MRTPNFIPSLFLFIFCTNIHAANCSEYPFEEGTNITETDGYLKIVATGSASVSGTDSDSIKDAREEATMEAKALISKFLNEEIKSDQQINKIVNESKTVKGNQSENNRTTVIERVKNLRNTSSALLKGVVILGSCYTKGEEVRVSVGIKPETIAQSEKLSGNIKDPKSIKKDNPVSPTGATNTKSNMGSGQPDEFNQTKNLDKF
jgi:hypothetical protein